MSEEFGASARVTLTIEVACSSRWGTTCSIDQVHKQAGEEAVGFIQNTIGNKVPESRVRLRIIGEPRVSCVIASKEQP